MSEAETQHTATLLPRAGVAVYSKDKDTLEAARALPDDWRFARVPVQAKEGDVDQAIADYREAASPNLVIVQTEDINEGFLEKLESLAENCAEGTNAIVVGPVNDVYLYRQLIDMGVSDYLVKPVDTGMLSEVIAKTLIEQIGVSASRLIACIGAKGGVGTSSLLEALALGTSEMLQQKTLVVDPSGGWSTHPVGMGYEPASTLAEAARAAAGDDEDSLKRMIQAVSGKLSVLSTGGEVMLEPSIQKDDLEVLLDRLMAKYPVVYVDLSGCDSDLKNIVCARANKIVVTSTAILPSLRLARSLLQEIRDVRGGEDSDVHMAINMQGFSPAYELKKPDIEKALEFKPSLYLPFDSKTFVSIECEDDNFATSKAGKAVLEQHIVPFLIRILGFDEDSTEKPAAGSGGNSAGVLGGLLGKLSRKE